MNALVDEKLDQVSIIEVNIKQRLSELSKAEKDVKRDRKVFEKQVET